MASAKSSGWKAIYCVRDSQLARLTQSAKFPNPKLRIALQKYATYLVRKNRHKPRTIWCAIFTLGLAEASLANTVSFRAVLFLP